MKSELAASGPDWYAVRPVKLTDGPQTGNVRAAGQFRMKTISRADVAWHILDIAEDPAPGPQRTPVITEGTGRAARTAAAGKLDLPAPPARRQRAGLRGFGKTGRKSFTPALAREMET